MKSEDDYKKVSSAKGALNTLFKAKEQGKIRHIGFSCHSIKVANLLLDNYDFDMTVVSYPQSQSPGSELMSMFSSDSANKNGAFNFPGIQDQDVDKLIEKIIYTKNRREMITAAKLMDRLLWNQFYMVPNWYINTHRVAFYNKFNMPKEPPLYYQATNYVLQTWSSK